MNKDAIRKLFEEVCEELRTTDKWANGECGMSKEMQAQTEKQLSEQIDEWTKELESALESQ